MLRFWAGPDRTPKVTPPWWLGFTALIYPPRCSFCRSPLADQGRAVLCPDCERELRWIVDPQCPCCGLPYPPGGSSHLCGDCLLRPPFYDQARAVVVYQGQVTGAIQRFKYRKEYLLSGALGWLGNRLKGEKPDFDTLIPVPLHPKRLRERGFNQALLLSRTLEDIPSKKIKPRLLKRIRHTPPQVRLDPDERRQNVRGAFEIDTPGVVRGKDILLVDDVFTTGATVNECARVLKKAGAGRVSVYTLARVVAP
jgi:ComF family protein